MTLRDVAIVGVHATEQARSLEHRTSFDLALESLTGAVHDAGLTLSDVDGVAVDWPGPGGVAGEAASWARMLGSNLHWTSDGLLDAAGTRGLLKASAAVAAGLCDVAVVGGGMAGVMTPGTTVKAPPIEFVDEFGGYVVPLFAMVAQRHMSQFGTTAEQIASVSATIRNQGSTNPEAIMFGRGPYTVDDILASPMLASPLHRLDTCLVGEGGAAFVVTTVERARDLRHEPVLVLGGGMEFAGAPYANAPLYREIGQLGRFAADRAFGLAGVGVHDIDVFCLYDPNSFEVIRQLEVLGLCEEGEGGPFVTHGELSPTGKHPVNPDGGCLSYAWNGTQQLSLKVVEAVRQLRGTAVHQLRSPKTALVSNAGSGAAHYELAILGADR